MKKSIADIRIGKRHRKHMGDLQALAESIQQQGLLHPIVVTSQNLLVVGERRLRACRDVLKWKEIDCTVIDVVSPLHCERDENDVRLDFTPSERLALADAVEEEAGERRGRPRATQSARQEKDGETEDPAKIVGNCRQFPAGQKTEDAAAEKAGFGSAREYRRVKKVVEDGTPALVEALDRGEVTPSVAATLTELSKPEQKKVAAQGPKAMKAKAKELRQSTADKNPAGKEYPHSERLVKWLQRVASETHIINVEMGGIKALLAQPDRWDWRDVHEHIVPMLEALAVTIAEFRTEIEAHATL